MLLRIRAIGINRSEVLFREGQHIESPRSFPARLGYEAAGVVEAVGPGVSRLSTGDEVSLVPLPSITTWGTYGHHVITPADHVVKHP